MLTAERKACCTLSNYIVLVTSAVMDETTKRFRLHVIKEIHQTEHDYTSSLEFTVDVCNLSTGFDVTM